MFAKRWRTWNQMTMTDSRFIINAMKKTHREQEDDFDGDDEDNDTQDEDYIENHSQINLAQDENSTKMEDFASQTSGCLNCKWLLSRHQRTRNKWIEKIRKCAPNAAVLLNFPVDEENVCPPPITEIAEQVKSTAGLSEVAMLEDFMNKISFRDSQLGEL
eukprot:gene7409-13164_t